MVLLRSMISTLLPDSVRITSIRVVVAVPGPVWPMGATEPGEPLPLVAPD
jgi:hypothetical protein